MTQLNKFENLNDWFLSLGIGMIQPNKFEDLNDQFASLGIGMAQPNKSLGTSDGLYSKFFSQLKIMAS